MDTSIRPWVIIGCGYTGTYLARALIERGNPLVVTRRTQAAAEALAAELGPTVRAARVELADPSSLVGVIPDGAVVVCSAGPGDDPAGEMQHLVTAARNAARLVYLSSTGVYGRANGAWVDEAAPTAPLSPTGAARVAAENAVALASVPSVSLRIAGIHGPGRGLLDRMRAGTYRIVGDGTAHISRIHVVDLVAVIIAAGDSDLTGAINVADDGPDAIGLVADTVASHLGVAAPPRVPVDSVSTEVAAMLTADRRIANARMKSLGVTLRYPSWRSLLK